MIAVVKCKAEFSMARNSFDLLIFFYVALNFCQNFIRFSIFFFNISKYTFQILNFFFCYFSLHFSIANVVKNFTCTLKNVPYVLINLSNITSKYFNNECCSSYIFNKFFVKYFIFISCEFSVFKQFYSVFAIIFGLKQDGSEFVHVSQLTIYLFTHCPIKLFYRCIFLKQCDVYGACSGKQSTGRHNQCQPSDECCSTTGQQNPFQFQEQKYSHDHNAAECAKRQRCDPAPIFIHLRPPKLVPLISSQLMEVVHA